jgi:hypothetical protein
MPSIARLLPLLGEDYQRKCIEPGIIRRAREIKTPADLMTLCLFHPLNGVSLLAVGAVAFALIKRKFQRRGVYEKVRGVLNQTFE